MKTYELLETKHPDLFRVVDRSGNWAHYYHKPTGRFLRSVSAILDGGYPIGEGLKNFLSSHTPGERDQILRTAGEKGDKVHRLIDQLLTKEVPALYPDSTVYNRNTTATDRISNDEWDALLSFARFWNAHAPILHKSEASVFSLYGDYAGTTDAILTLTKACDVKTCKCEELIGKIGLWDWKTSGGIYPQYSAQASAYAFADNIKEYLPEGVLKVDYLAVLRIGTNHKTTGGYELKSFDPDEAYKRFTAARRLANFGYEPFTFADITEIPEVIKIVIQTPKPAKKKRAKKVLSPAAAKTEPVVDTAPQTAQPPEGGKRTKRTKSK